MAVAGIARWTWIWPLLASAILLITLVLGGGGIVYAAAGAALFGAVFAAVYHAEMVAHRVGEIVAAAHVGESVEDHSLEVRGELVRRAGDPSTTALAWSTPARHCYLLLL